MGTRTALTAVAMVAALCAPARASHVHLHRCKTPTSLGPANRFSVAWMPCRVGAAVIRSMLKDRDWTGSSWEHPAAGPHWAIVLECTGQPAPGGRLIRCRVGAGDYKGRKLAGARLRALIATSAARSRHHQCRSHVIAGTWVFAIFTTATCHHPFNIARQWLELEEGSCYDTGCYVWVRDRRWACLDTDHRRRPDYTERIKVSCITSPEHDRRATFSYVT